MAGQWTANLSLSEPILISLTFGARRRAGEHDPVTSLTLGYFLWALL
jgi:hypothetical protein